MNQSIMITGANSGLGKEAARQLALRSETQKIYLACRNEQKAQTAKKELEQLTGRTIFDIILLDIAKPDSVRAAVATLPAPIDALLMNAGGTGGPDPLALTSTGVTQLFAANLLGHVVLLEELLHAQKLRHVAVYVGSEAARGVAKLGIKAPGLATSSEAEFASIINGSFFAGRQPDPAQAYGQVKYMGALWMAALAQAYPQLRFITMSPGNTKGTALMSAMPLPLRLAMQYILQPIVMPLLGIVHSLSMGGQRLVMGLSDESLCSGTFYASQQQKLTGPVVDQSTFFPDLANTTYQDNANAAIHQFIS